MTVWNGLQNRVIKSGKIAKIGKSDKTGVSRKNLDVVKKNPRSAPDLEEKIGRLSNGKI